MARRVQTAYRRLPCIVGVTPWTDRPDRGVALELHVPASIAEFRELAERLQYSVGSGQNSRTIFAHPMLEYRTNSPDTRAYYSLRDELASSDRDFVVRVRDGPVLA